MDRTVQEAIDIIASDCAIGEIVDEVPLEDRYPLAVSVARLMLILSR